MASNDSEKGRYEAGLATFSDNEISPAVVRSDRQFDDSYEAYKSLRGADIDPAESKRVLRRIDIRILPILVVTYMLQYLDKNTISFASVYGLQAATNLHGQDFSWLSSIFYFGYLAFQFPSGYLLQRLPVGKFLACTTIAWGVILMTTPACTSFAGLATNRFLLGAFESAVNPGFVLLMSMWFRTEEQPLRLETYYSTNGVATMFGGLIGYAIGNITGGLQRWMYIFFIFGAVSIFWGFCMLFFLPDLPSSAQFLNERERAVAVDRVAANRQGVKNHHFKSYQAWQTAKDPKTWILFIMATGAQIPNSALTSFASINVASFGFDALGSQYLQIPGGAVQFISLIIGGWVCTRWPGYRCATMVVANTVCILGAGLLVGLPNSNKWGRLVALWLCYFQSLGFSMSLTMVSSNVAGYTKKQLTAAILFCGYCIGNIIGPQSFLDSEKNTGYHSAYIAMLVGYVVKLGMVIVLYIFMWRANKARDAEQAARGELSEEENREAIEQGMLDVTELDNKGFRYIL